MEFIQNTENNGTPNLELFNDKQRKKLLKTMRKAFKLPKATVCGIKGINEAAEKSNNVVVVVPFDGSLQSYALAYLAYRQHQSHLSHPRLVLARIPDSIPIETTRLIDQIDFSIFDIWANFMKRAGVIDIDGIPEIYSEYSVWNSFSNQIDERVTALYGTDDISMMIWLPYTSGNISPVVLQYAMERAEYLPFLCYMKQRTIDLPFMRYTNQDLRYFLSKGLNSTDMLREGEFMYHDFEEKFKHGHGLYQQTLGVDRNVPYNFGKSIMTMINNQFDPVKYPDDLFGTIEDELRALAEGDSICVDTDAGLATFRVEILSRIIGAMHIFSMTERPDKSKAHFVIGLSGGKDSVCLLHAMHTLTKLQPHFNEYYEPFDVSACVFDPQMTGFDPSIATRHTAGVNEEVTCHVTSCPVSNIAKRVIKPGITLCSLCSKLRRGYLYGKIEEVNGTHLVLGHNLDDQLETTFMNTTHCSQTYGIRAIYTSDAQKEVNISVARPLLFCSETQIKEFIAENDIQVVSTGDRVCDLARSENLKEPAARDRMEAYLVQVMEDIPMAKENLMRLCAGMAFYWPSNPTLVNNENVDIEDVVPDTLPKTEN
ncbi:hypothetical protein PCE1_003862 [Barthelona sp. PCE]